MAQFIWTQKQDIGPAPRWRHACAFDAERKQLILFGGLAADASLTGDTWAWDGHFWTQVADIGPAPRAEHAMAYDAERERVVLFGGEGHGDRVSLGDTWEWDGELWSQIADTGPSARTGHAMAYDPQLKRVVLFGGGAFPDLRRDTWTWDGADWAQVADTGPAPRQLHAMAYAGALQKVVLVGGQDTGGAALADTWAFDGQAAWTQIDDIGPGPVTGATLADTGGGLVLFGGAAGVDAPGGFGPGVGATWLYAAQHWTQVQDIGPSARWRHAGVFDDARGAVVLFGGLPVHLVGDQAPIPASAALGDTWELPAAAAGPVGPLTIAQVALSQPSLPPFTGASIQAIVTLNGPAGAVAIPVSAQILRASSFAPVDPNRASVNSGVVPAHGSSCILTITRGPNVIINGPPYLLRVQIAGAPFFDAPFQG